jgi:hypothetical protein
MQRAQLHIKNAREREATLVGNSGKIKAGRVAKLSKS